ncbi:MAG: plasmid partitioning protein RepB C-terminal domain-containing protein [Verrucomicrobiota bacterium]
MKTEPNKPARIAFETELFVLRLEDLLPIRQVDKKGHRSKRYESIVTSIREIGLIEPLMVFPHKGEKGRYLVMDGHSRLLACQEIGITEVACLITLDDESYTYNAKINRLAPIQEQRMILKAIENGVPIAKIASALNLKEKDIRARMRVTEGLCQEVVDKLKDKQVPPPALRLLRKVVKTRQIEIAELLVAANNYSRPYIEAMVFGTAKEKLISKHLPRTKKVKAEDLERMQGEMEALTKEYKMCEQTFAASMLHLTLFRAFLKKLLSNPKVDRFLNNRHGDLHRELTEIAASEVVC